MAILKFTHPHYKGDVTMILCGNTVELYNNNELVEQHSFSSYAAASQCFDNNKRFYTGRAS